MRIVASFADADLRLTDSDPETWASLHQENFEGMHSH